ncbi:MAG: hypothetical protein V1844_10135 [Pseudomonadota bacterium]
MKKIGLTFLTLLFVTGLMVGGAQARWDEHHRRGRGEAHHGRERNAYRQPQWRGHHRLGWGLGLHLGVPLVVGRPLYPYGYYPAPPVVVRQSRVVVQPLQESSNYWYYCENPKGYYP